MVTDENGRIRRRAIFTDDYSENVDSDSDYSDGMFFLTI